MINWLAVRPERPPWEISQMLASFSRRSYDMWIPFRSASDRTIFWNSFLSGDPK